MSEGIVGTGNGVSRCLWAVSSHARIDTDRERYGTTDLCREDVGLVGGRGCGGNETERLRWEKGQRRGPVPY
jgi:hypothetical protein